MEPSCRPGENGARVGTLPSTRLFSGNDPMAKWTSSPDEFARVLDLIRDAPLRKEVIVFLAEGLSCEARSKAAVLRTELCPKGLGNRRSSFEL